MLLLKLRFIQVGVVADIIGSGTGSVFCCFAYYFSSTALVVRITTATMQFLPQVRLNHLKGKVGEAVEDVEIIVGLLLIPSMRFCTIDRTL